MTTTTAELVTQLQVGQDDLAAGQAAMIATLDVHTQIFRTLTEQLRVLIERLTPDVDSGPTLQELLAALVGKITDVDVMVRRIDRRTESMADTLHDDVVRVIRRADGANGDDNADGQESGSASP